MFVVDEYGAVQGVITVRDVLEAITGEFAPPSATTPWAVRRDDGSWLMDGLIPVPELKDRLELRDLPEEDRGRYNTLAGMIMLLLGRLPKITDRVDWQGWRFEVVDLDGKRVDKVLVMRSPRRWPSKTHDQPRAGCAVPGTRNRPDGTAGQARPARPASGARRVWPRKRTRPRDP